jgi:signal transduction histidine kinase
MKKHLDYVEAHEEWLMERILHYAKLHGYAQYASTLKEAWRLSISGLSQALRLAHESGQGVKEFGAEDTNVGDPAADFAVLEARRHRQRGVDLAMFLGLFKYYRQCYLDLIAESPLSEKDKQTGNLELGRFFDRIEIAFCSEWAGEGHDDRDKELRSANLRLTNEKNKYLTIFASLAMPVFLVDKNNCLVDLNHAASAYLGQKVAPGSHYYGQEHMGPDGELVSGECIEMKMLLPWLEHDLEAFVKDDSEALTLDKDVDGKSYKVSFARMLDISGKFRGLVVIIYDVTEERKAEKRKEERDKLQAAIETAGAVCHEMSQPMQVLIMRAEIAKLKAGQYPELQEELARIIEQITHIGEITHRLLSLTAYKTKEYIDGEKILDLT